MKRLVLFIPVAALLSGCVTERKVHRYLNDNPRFAAEYAAVKFPPKTVQGETKIVKVVDSVERIVIVKDTVDCPDGTRIVVEKDVQYVVQKEYLHRVDTVTNSAGEERERLRANEAEREVAVKDGQLSGEKEKAKSRLYWIIGLGSLCVLLLAFILRKVF